MKFHITKLLSGQFRLENRTGYWSWDDLGLFNSYDEAAAHADQIVLRSRAKPEVFIYEPDEEHLSTVELKPFSPTKPKARFVPQQELAPVNPPPSAP
jgi:hypothetical protein